MPLVNKLLYCYAQLVTIQQLFLSSNILRVSADMANHRVSIIKIICVRTVSIATRYGLDGPGIGSWWGRDFLHPYRPVHGAHPVSYTMATGYFPGVNRPERNVDHPLPSRAEVEGRVELYIRSPSGSSWPVIG